MSDALKSVLILLGLIAYIFAGIKLVNHFDYEWWAILIATAPGIVYSLWSFFDQEPEGIVASGLITVSVLASMFAAWIQR